MSFTKMATELLCIIFCLCHIIQVNRGQECSLEGPPRFDSYKDEKEITRHHQAIIPRYKLDCGGMCGNITEWGVDLQPGGNNHQGAYTLDFQVWRPSPTVDDSTGTGCYSLVGNNRFTNISVSGGVAEVTPSPQDYIQFKTGDVLGFYVEVARGANDGVVVLDDKSFTSELVWHASIARSMATSQNGDCPYSVGSNGGVLNTCTRAAPVISISITTFSCPSPPSMATTQPTPPPIPTTDSEETSPTTNQQTREPTVDPQTTNGESPTSPDPTDHLVTDSETETSYPVTDLSTTSKSNGTNDTTDSSLPLGLALGFIFLAIIAITIAISIAVCWKAREIARATFRMQRNRAYHGATVHDQDMTNLEESTILYIYPTVDNDENEQNNTAIITEKNRAYESRTTLCSEIYDDPLQNLELNYAEVYTDGIAGACNSENDQEQSEATLTAAKDWSQASLECNKAYGIAILENTDAYESMTDSGTVDKYDYIQD